MSQQGNSNAYLKSLRIFCIALISGIIMFSCIVFGLSYFEPGATGSLRGYFGIAITVSIVFALACFLIARQLFGKKMQAIRNDSVNVSEKLNQYRAALISYMALCDAPALLAIILFFLTGIYWLLLVVLMMLLAMAMKFPNKQRIAEDMGLDWKEQEELE